MKTGGVRGGGGGGEEIACHYVVMHQRGRIDSTDIQLQVVVESAQYVLGAVQMSAL